MLPRRHPPPRPFRGNNSITITRVAVPFFPLPWRRRRRRLCRIPCNRWIGKLHLSPPSPTQTTAATTTTPIHHHHRRFGSREARRSLPCLSKMAVRSGPCGTVRAVTTSRTPGVTRTRVQEHGPWLRPPGPPRHAPHPRRPLFCRDELLLPVTRHGPWHSPKRRPTPL